MTRIPSSVALRLVRIGEEIRRTPPLADEFKAYTARMLVMATLPHSDPGDVPVWQRENGWFTLTIHPTTDKTGRRLYPSGSIPRLVLYWLVTEAVRTGSRRIDLGPSLAEFLRKVGLDPATGGGKRGDARRLGNQLHRLFNAQIRIVDGLESKPFQTRSLTMTVVEFSDLWWTATTMNQRSLFGNYLILGDAFFREVTSHSFPVDRRALEALRRRPLALDLYAWLSYRIRALQGGTLKLSWKLIADQLGASYANPNDFSKAAREALRMIKAVYPGLNYDCPNGRLTILPSRPAVPGKNRRITQVVHGETLPFATANDTGAFRDISPTGHGETLLVQTVKRSHNL